MRICILQDHLRNGGTERQSLLLARRFLAEGHEVELIRFRAGGALEADAAGVPGCVLQPFDCLTSAFAPGLIRRLRATQPDVVLCMGREANRRGHKVAAALPSTVVVATLRTGKPLPAGFRRTLEAADVTVANSAASGELLRTVHGVPAERVAVIKNGMVFPPATTSTERNRALRAELGADDDTVVLLCAGMFRPEKNQSALLDVAARLPRGAKWRLWLAGAGPTEAACRDQCARLDLLDRVRFLGFQRDAAPFHRAADVAVLASRSESLSNFLIEAQAHGLPAVACAATGVDECLEDGRSGRVVPVDDPDAFTAALIPLLNNAPLRAAWGEHAREFARTAFDPVARANDYLKLFAERKRLKD